VQSDGADMDPFSTSSRGNNASRRSSHRSAPHISRRSSPRGHPRAPLYPGQQRAVDEYRPPAIRLHSIRPGEIKWLRDARELGMGNDEHVNRAIMERHLPDLRLGLLAHPVIIYSVDDVQREVELLVVSDSEAMFPHLFLQDILTCVIQCTSFRENESFETKFGNNPKLQPLHLPLHPAQPHPVNQILLKAELHEGPRVLPTQWRKATYVSLTRFRCPFWALRNEAQGDWALDRDSFDKCREYMATIWEDTVPYR
jgi:hypothetical protein